jgi:hypothetical protein
MISQCRNNPVRNDMSVENNSKFKIITMESGNHFKNGANPKSLTSRRQFIFNF